MIGSGAGCSAGSPPATLNWPACLNGSSPLLDLPIQSEPIPAAGLVALGLVAGAAVLLSGLPRELALPLAALCLVLAGVEARELLRPRWQALQRHADGGLQLIDAQGRALPVQLSGHALLGPWCLLVLRDHKRLWLLLSARKLGPTGWRALRRWLVLDLPAQDSER